MKSRRPPYILTIGTIWIVFCLAACGGLSQARLGQQNQSVVTPPGVSRGQGPILTALRDLSTAPKSLTITHHTGDFIIKLTEPQSMSPCSRGVEFHPEGNDYVCYSDEAPKQEVLLSSLELGLTTMLPHPTHCCKILWTPGQPAIVFAEPPKGDTEQQLIKAFRVDTKSITSLGSSYRGYFQFTPDHRFVYLPEGEWTIAEIATGPEIKLENAHKIDQLASRLPFQDNLQPGIEVTFSPDGEKFAMLEVNIYGDQHPLSILNLNTKETIPVTLQAGYNPNEGDAFSWSPDGQTLAYQTILTGSQTAELRLVAADGSNSRVLTQTPERMRYNSLNWLPNGKGLIYALTPSSGTNSWMDSQIFVISADGGTPQLLFSGGNSPHLMADLLMGEGQRLTVYRESYDKDTGKIVEAGEWLVLLFYE